MGNYQCDFVDYHRKIASLVGWINTEKLPVYWVGLAQKNC